MSSVNESIRDLLDKLQELQLIHGAGATCYDKTKAWNQKQYGWHNPLFPPEYRRSCLSGEEFHMNASCDLYYLMACYYEKITGHRPPHNFELDHVWKKGILACTSDWKQLYQDAVIWLIAACTKWKDCHRIQDATELMNTSSVSILRTYIF